MKLNIVKTEIAELKLVEKIGKTVVIIFYLRFPGLQREFMCARPLNKILDINDTVNFETIDLTQIDPITADHLLLGKSVRTMHRFGIKIHRKVQFRVENYYWPYLKSFPSSTFDSGTDFEKLTFYLEDENAKPIETKSNNFNQIAHLGYDHGVHIEYFRIGLSIIWANYLNISPKIITDSVETIENFSKGTIELIESQFQNLRNFTNIPKEFWYCPLPKEGINELKES